MSFGRKVDPREQRDSSRYDLTKRAKDGRVLDRQTVTGAARAQEIQRRLNHELTKAERDAGISWIVDPRSGIGRYRLAFGFRPGRS